MRAVARGSGWVLVALALVACTDRGPGPQGKRVDPGYVPKHLLKVAPALDQPLDVDLGGKVRYLGNKVTATRIVPGQVITITHYWQVTAAVGAGWRVFSMVRGAPNTADFMSLGETEMQRAHPPATWSAGQIIEDEQELVLRPDWRSAEATLTIGLIAEGAHGAGGRMAATGPHVDDRAIRARTFEVDLSRAPPPAGTVHVPYAQGPIVIDGVENDPGWAGALMSPNLVTAEGSRDPVGKATVKLTWDADYLYLFATIADTDIYSEYKNQDDPLWKADCIEMFIDADNNKRGYVELQVNPNNATFDSWFPGGRAAKGDEAWDAGMITAVTVRGTPDVAGDTDKGWDVEVAIPWPAVKGRDPAMNVQLPPKVGDRWRLNVVRVDRRSGAKDPLASSWNRISYSDFHGLDRMLTVVFAGTTGVVTPNAPVDPRAPAPPPEGVGSGAGSGSGSGAGAGAGAGAGSGAGSGAVAPPAGAMIAPMRRGAVEPAKGVTRMPSGDRTGARLGSAGTVTEGAGSAAGSGAGSAR